MARTKRWIWKDLDHGCCEVKLTSWKYFSDFIYQEMQYFDLYVWRGQRCDNWLLDPTLNRVFRDRGFSVRKMGTFQAKHLEQFKYATRGRRGTNPPVICDDNDWWALGQHHGLATPLLDWTTSPYVAAYFAFIESGENQTAHRAIYALGRAAVEKRVKDLFDEEVEKRRKIRADIESGTFSGGLLLRNLADIPARPEVAFVRPLSNENQRLVSQGGLFTRSPEGKSIEAWVRERFPEDEQMIVLLKILVPNRDRSEALRMLNRMNINHLSLFPDLSGASVFCNLFSEINNY